MSFRTPFPVTNKKFSYKTKDKKGSATEINSKRAPQVKTVESTDFLHIGYIHILSKIEFLHNWYPLGNNL